MTPACASVVAGAVGIITLMGFVGLWIASGLPESVESGLSLVVGVVAAFVAAPAVGADVPDALVASLVVGCVVAAMIGRWQPNVMFSRAGTYALGYIGVLAMLAEYVADAPSTPQGGFSVTLNYLVASVSRGLATGFASVAELLPGVGC